MTRRRLIFTGHVQGVGFRAMTRSIAQNFSVTGWVRNDPEGTVSAEIQGDPAEIDQFLMDHELQLGGYTKAVQDDTIDAESGETSFEIRN